MDTNLHQFSDALGLVICLLIIMQNKKDLMVDVKNSQRTSLIQCMLFTTLQPQMGHNTLTPFSFSKNNSTSIMPTTFVAVNVKLKFKSKSATQEYLYKYSKMFYLT